MTYASNHINRRRSTKHRSIRRPAIESLEQRQLLALTPQLIADVNAVGADSNPLNLVAEGEFAIVADKLMFFANDGTHGNKLWSTDGTAEGTRLVKDIIDGAERTRVSPSLIAISGTLASVVGRDRPSMGSSQGTTTLMKTKCPSHYPLLALCLVGRGARL